MKKVFVLIIASFLFLLSHTWVYAGIFGLDSGGNDISKENFMVSVDDFFPSFGTTDKIANSSGDGISNVPKLIHNLIPMLTTLMAVGTTLMIVWGGYQMIFGGASPSQTEAGKGIIKDAIIGLSIGLLSYVLVLWTAGGKKLTNIDEGSLGLPGESAPNFISVLKNVTEKLQDIVAIIGVLGICIVGIMYIMSQGSEEKTEAAKKYMVTILIGVILAFTAWGIMSLINLIPNSFSF